MDQPNKRNTNTNCPSHEQLLQYLNGELSEQEAARIDELIMEDPMLMAALESLDEAGATKESLPDLEKMEAVFIEGAREQAGKEKATPERNESSFKWWRIAAILVLIIGGGFVALQMINSGGGQPIEIYAFSERGLDTRYGDLSEAIGLYNNEEYEEAIASLSKIEPNHVQYELAVFVLANAHAALEQYDKATQQTQIYLSKTQWFLYKERMEKLDAAIKAL